jgi:hypothetical protein
MMLRGRASAQANSDGTRPSLLDSALSEVRFLDEAKKSLGRAREFESKHALFDAVQEYEDLIASSGKLSATANLMHGYEYYVVLAGAHLDAARTRMAYGVSFNKNLDLTEQNRVRIENHLRAVPNLVVEARQSVAGRPGYEKSLCSAYKLLAYGQFLTGMIDLTSKDLLGAIETYKKVAACDPESAPQAQAMISYTKSVEADISKKTLRADNVAKVVSKFVSVSVPKVGSYLSMAIDLGYESYKEKKKSPSPSTLR